MRSITLLIALLAACLAQRVIGEEFRSYHPHYLHSYSYAQPSTLHLYYGRVRQDQPLFLIKDAEEQDTENIYQVNVGSAPRAVPKLLNLKKEVDL